MKANIPILLMLTTITSADIGEKLRLGQSVKAVPQRDFSSGLQAPLSTNVNAVSEARATNYSDDEDNLERLCNDPFHSFLCKPVGPRKNKIDGQLRAGAQIPPDVLTGLSSNQQPVRTGGALLAAAIQPSTSYNSKNEYLPPIYNQQSLAAQQSRTNPVRPSNEYLPSNSAPIPKTNDNIQYSLPLGQPQQNVYRYTSPPVSPNAFNSQNNKSPFRQQTQFPLPTTPQPIRKLPQTIRPTVRVPTSTIKPVARPSNQYLPVVEPIDIRINPSSTNLSPLIQGGSLLAQARQASPTEIQPKKHERQHTLEELCNDAFHSFLCKPITKPRKRIDGRIRPGAKIPPHVLQSAGSAAKSTAKLAPQKKGAALLSQGREEPKGYYYERPLNKPFFDSQATNQQPVKANILNDNLPPIPKKIPPPGTTAPNLNAFAKNNQFVVTQKPKSTSQKPIQNFQFQNNYQTQNTYSTTRYQTTSRPITANYQFTTSTTKPIQIFPIKQSLQNDNAQIQSQSNYFSSPQNRPSFVYQATTPQSVQNNLLTDNLPPIPKRIPPTKNNQLAATQNPFQNIQFQTENIYSTTRRPATSQQIIYQTPITTVKPNQLIFQQFSERSQTGNNILAVNQNPVAAQAQISSQFQPFNNVNQLATKTENGYQYSKPSTAFTYPTTTRKPITTPNLLYIPSFQNNPSNNLQLSQNQIVTTTQRPLSTLKTPISTRGYDYQKPSVAFTLPSTKYTVPPTVTQSAFPSNNQPVAITTSKPFSQDIKGYTYLKPARPFTLPTTSTLKPNIEGYTYPRPSKPFTLPPSNNVYNIDVRTLPEQPINNQFNFQSNNALNGGKASDTLPPDSQFEIIKP